MEIDKNSFIRITMIEYQNLLNQIEELKKDVTTGCQNKESFFNSLKTNIAMMDREQINCLSICMLDMDYFKKVNDTYGHIVGDDVLKQFTKEIINNIREIDTLYRYGGDEFGIILPDANSEQSSEILNRVKEKIENKLFVGKIKMTMSAGIYQICDTSLHIKDILNKADEALYVSKKQGRNQVNIFNIK